MTRQELADKVDWEGGIAEAITGYGIGPANLPDDMPDDVHSAWMRLYNRGTDIGIISEWLYA